MTVNDSLKDLVCPLGKKELIFNGNYLICVNCGVKFYIRDGIPVLIIDEAVLPEGINSISSLNCMKK